MPPTTPESLGLSSARLARIQPAMQRYIDAKKLAGIITLIFRHGQIAHFQTFGSMDIEAGRPMHPDALFRIYSMTKPITSTAVLMLMEEGALRLSDPVTDYIPSFKDIKVYQPRGTADFGLVPPTRPITIHDLLTHTSGLSYGFEENSYVDGLYQTKVWQRFDKEPDLTLAQMVEGITKLPLAHQPGTAFRYSVATDVLGYLVQVISGQPFDLFLKEQIFTPLKMQDTSFTVPPEKVSRFTANYGPEEGGGLKVIDAPATSNYTKPTQCPSGGGGLISSTLDYLRFCQMLLNKGELDGVRLLGRKTVEWMTSNHIPAGMFDGGNNSMGFGLGGAVVLDAGRSTIPGSVGSFTWGGAANTKFWIDFQEQLIAILMLQFMPSDLYPVATDFTNLVYQALVD